MSDLDLTGLPKDTYVSMRGDGNCRVCGALKDLRMGCCFPCSEFVEGIEIPGGHELWDIRNPSNRWKVLEQ